MAKIPCNGFLEEVSEIEYVGQNGQTAKQKIVIRVPAWVDRYGEKKGQDEHWQITLLNDAIDKYNLYSNQVGSKVEAEIWIKSRRYESPEGKVMYFVESNLASFRFVQNNQHAGRRTGHTAQAQSSPSYGPGSDYYQEIAAHESSKQDDEPPF